MMKRTAKNQRRSPSPPPGSPRHQRSPSETRCRVKDSSKRMCFGPATLGVEDHYNERQGKGDISKKKNKLKKDEKDNGPSKFLISNLNEIVKILPEDTLYGDQYDKSLFTSSWGRKFWISFSSGNDIIETSGTSATEEQIAWIVSTAADTIATREKDDDDDESNSNLCNPFLLYLVESQSKAAKVQRICEALKSIGIHTLNIHQNAPLDHQLNGLKRVEPEFVVATPTRLLEIVKLKGIDISGVSLLVIDELGSLCTGGVLDAVKSIKQSISSKHQSIVFNSIISASNIPAIQSLLGKSISRVTISDSIVSQGSYIIQTVNVCATEEKKMQKFEEILDSFSPEKKRYILTKKECFGKIKTLLKLNVHTRLARYIDIEQLDTSLMENFEIVLLPDFFPKIETYTQILTSMARHSVHGVLQSFITKEAVAYQAEPLVKVLEDCGQNTPELWRNMDVAMSD